MSFNYRQNVTQAAMMMTTPMIQIARNKSNNNSHDRRNDFDLNHKEKVIP